MTMNETHGVETQTETTATGDVATGQNIDSQVEAAKTFTQEEVNLLVGKRVAAVNKKYENVDVEEYKALKGLKEQIEEETLIKKEDFFEIENDILEKFWYLLEIENLGLKL